MITKWATCVSFIIIVVLAGPSETKDSNNYGDYEYYEYDDYEEKPKDDDDECFDWTTLGTKFKIAEVSCQWCHNRLTISDGKKTILEFRTVLFRELDMEVYDGKGKYQGFLDYHTISHGFKLTIKDCNNKMVGIVEEGHMDMWMNQNQIKTKVNIYNGTRDLIGYSVRTEHFGKEIEISNERSKKVWVAKRDSFQGFKTITCSDPKWEVKKYSSGGALRDDGIMNPMYVTSLVAIEGLKNIGTYDTCTSLIIAGIIIGIIALIAVACGTAYLFRAAIAGYTNID